MLFFFHLIKRLIDRFPEDVDAMQMLCTVTPTRGCMSRRWVTQRWIQHALWRLETGAVISFFRRSDVYRLTSIYAFEFQ